MNISKFLSVVFLMCSTQFVLASDAFQVDVKVNGRSYTVDICNVPVAIEQIRTQGGLSENETITFMTSGKELNKLPINEIYKLAREASNIYAFVKKN